MKGNTTMTTQNQTPAAGSNRDTILSAIDREMAKLGAESINIARPKLAITLVKHAAAGEIDEDDVEARYDAYLAGREKTQAKNALAQGVEDGNGKKANVSKCRQLVRMAMLPALADGEADMLVSRTVTVRGNLIGTDAKVEAPFDAFVKVARRQLDQPDTVLTDEQIAEAVKKPEKADKSEIDKLIDLYKKSAKLHEVLTQNNALQRAVAEMAEAITEAGGEIPALTKEEKEEQAAMAYLAKRGLVIVPAITNQMAAE
jgi:hypothetical protein